MPYACVDAKVEDRRFEDSNPRMEYGHVDLEASAKVVFSLLV